MPSQVEALPDSKRSLIERPESPSVLSVIKSHLSGLVELPFDDPNVRSVINSLRFASYDRLLPPRSSLTKERAFRYHLPEIIGGLARKNHWRLDSPEIKYITGFFFRSHMAKRIRWLKGQIKDLETGARRFFTKEQILERQKAERSELSRLRGLQRRVDINLRELVATYFSQAKDGRKYTRVLQLLTRLYENDLMFPKARELIRDEISKLLRAGEIAAAYNFLKQKIKW